jgi:hypothetical protein
MGPVIEAFAAGPTQVEQNSLTLTSTRPVFDNFFTVAISALHRLDSRNHQYFYSLPTCGM